MDDLLVAKVSCSSEQHRDVMSIGCGDHFVVADTASGLDNRSHSAGGEKFQTVGKGEECITCRNRIDGSITSTSDRDSGRINSVLLTATNADCLSRFSNDNGIGHDCGTDFPSHDAVEKFAW